MYKAILFDLDGTLLDTTEGVVHAVKRAITELGMEMPPYNELLEYVGPPMQLSFMKHYGMEKKEALDAANLFRKIYKEESLFLARVYDGVFGILEYLKTCNIKIAVATNKSHFNAIEILKHFGISEYCDCMMGSDLEGKLQKADIIIESLKKLDVPANEALYIGDSEFDLEGANIANIQFLGVTYGFGFSAKGKYSFDVISNIIELDEYLKGKDG